MADEPDRPPKAEAQELESSPAGLAPLYVDTLLRAHAYAAAAGLGGVVAATITAAVLAAADMLLAWPAALLVGAELGGTAWVATRANRIDREFQSMAADL